MSLSTTDVRLCLLWGHYGFSWEALDKRLRKAAFDRFDALAGVRATTKSTRNVLRRVYHRASLEEREDAVRWLLALGPRSRAALADAEMRAVSTAELLARLEDGCPTMPRREMQELVRRGDAVSASLIAILRRGQRHPNTRGLLWAVVVLGVLAEVDAIDALVRLLRHPSSEITGAAAEALGRIGAPALDVLRRAALEGRGGVAVHAYGGLAMMRTDEAFAFLCERLEHSPAHADLAAAALACHRRPEALPVLRAQRRRVPDWMRGTVADAIGALSRDRPADPVAADWRLRYRRLPNLGWGLPPSWIQVAALVRGRRQAATGRTGSSRLAAHRYCESTTRRCRRCAGSIWEPIGLPVCAHTASAVVELQAGIIKRWRDEGIHDAWVALDACDAADLARSASPGEASVGPTMNLVAVARATLYWMVAAGLEDVRAAAMHLRLVVRDIRALYDPHQRASGEKAISAPFRYSNDPAASRPQIFS